MKFLIYSFNYDWRSGGNQALHDLGKILAKTHETYLFATNSIRNTKAICVNKDQAIDIAKQSDVITIYPEVISGNPFNAVNVLRWVLYYPGRHGAGDMVYNSDEVIFAYHSIYVENSLYSKCPLLKVIDSKMDIMTNKNGFRKNTGILIRKGKSDYLSKIHYLDKHKDLFKGGVINIDVEILKCNDLKELSTLYNQFEYFISLDSFTYHSTMAALCGCKSIVVPSNELSKHTFHSYIETKYGIAYGFEDLDYAIDTLPLLRQELSKLDNDTNVSVQNMVKYMENYLKEKK
jgi:hypothetical protein